MRLEEGFLRVFERSKESTKGPSGLNGLWNTEIDLAFNR